MPKSDIAASAEARLKALYPEGGPGRQLKARLAAREVLVGGMVLEYTRPSLMKLYQQAGYDFVYIEYEHAYFGMAEFADTVVAARDNGLPVVAKTPQLERQEVAKLLECGVVGMQLPRTETREEIETLIDYIKLYPKGSRASATGYGSSDYIKPTDRQGWIAGQDAETRSSFTSRREPGMPMQRRSSVRRASTWCIAVPETPRWNLTTPATGTIPTYWGRWSRCSISASGTASRSVRVSRGTIRPLAGSVRARYSSRKPASWT